MYCAIRSCSRSAVKHSHGARSLPVSSVFLETKRGSTLGWCIVPMYLFHWAGHVFFVVMTRVFCADFQQN